MAIHQSCGDQTENQLMCELTDMKAKDSGNIVNHLTNIKQLWDRCTLICRLNLPITPKQFKKFMVYSLPPSWDEFTQQYQRNPTKINITIHQYIRECNEEYHQRLLEDYRAHGPGARAQHSRPQSHATA
jgi:hypothetical protein